MIKCSWDVGDAFEWDVTIYPRDQHRGTVATTNGWAIWSVTKAQDAGWQPLKFLQTDHRTVWLDAIIA